MRVRRPSHGTKMRWQDKVKKDLKKFGIEIEERGWFRLAQDKARWRGCCKTRLERVTRKDLSKMT